MYFWVSLSSSHLQFPLLQRAHLVGKKQCGHAASISVAGLCWRWLVRWRNVTWNTNYACSGKKRRLCGVQTHVFTINIKSFFFCWVYIYLCHDCLYSNQAKSHKKAPSVRQKLVDSRTQNTWFSVCSKYSQTILCYFYMIFY